MVPLFAWARNTDTMVCTTPNYAKPFRKIPTAWAPQKLHLILQTLTPLPADQRMYCCRDRDVACHYWQEVSFFQLAFSKAARPFCTTTVSPLARKRTMSK